MENLNAEQIKKALERDIRISIDLHYECPRITYSKLRETLALITAQEQRIKELTEENEAWQKQLISEKEKADKAYYNLACEVEELRSENEDLKAQCQYTTEAFHSVKADTVRNMQERLQEYFGTYVLGYKIPLTDALKAVNQIAKEVLGE